MVEWLGRFRGTHGYPCLRNPRFFPLNWTLSGQVSVGTSRNLQHRWFGKPDFWYVTVVALYPTYSVKPHLTYPLVNVYSLLWKDPPFFMGKSTISMAIFNSYFDITRGVAACWFQAFVLFHDPPMGWIWRCSGGETTKQPRTVILFRLRKPYKHQYKLCFKDMSINIHLIFPWYPILYRNLVSLVSRSLTPRCLSWNSPSRRTSGDFRRQKHLNIRIYDNRNQSKVYVPNQ